MKKYTITEGEYDLMCAKVQSLENENNRLKGYIEGLTEQLRIAGVMQAEPEKVLGSSLKIENIDRPVYECIAYDTGSELEDLRAYKKDMEAYADHLERELKKPLSSNP